MAAPFMEFWGRAAYHSVSLLLLNLGLMCRSINMTIVGGLSISDTRKIFLTGAPESILDRCTTLMLPDGRLQPLTEEHTGQSSALD